MNRTELTRALADKAGLTLSQARDCMEALFGVATDAPPGGIITDSDGLLVECLISAVHGYRAVLSGFGTIKVVERKARLVTKPGTSQRFIVPAKRVVTWSAGGALKARVAGR